MIDEREENLREITRENLVRNRIQPEPGQPFPTAQVNANNGIVLKSFSSLSSKSRKKDVINLLAIEGIIIRSFLLATRKKPKFNVLENVFGRGKGFA